MLKKLIKKISPGIFFEIIILLISLRIGAYFQWETSNLIFFLLFVILIFHRIASRFVLFGAIIFLIATAILFMIKQDELAKTSAIWAYYFMILTATASFLELQDEKNDDIIDKD